MSGEIINFPKIKKPSVADMPEYLLYFGVAGEDLEDGLPLILEDGLEIFPDRAVLFLMSQEKQNILVPSKEFNLEDLRTLNLATQELIKKLENFADEQNPP